MFLSIARGSAMEVDSHTEMAVRVDLLPRADVERAQGLANEVIRMLSTMMRRIAPLK
jgi:four helix bundle protein